MLFFFFNDPATTEIYTLSLHDALPIFTNTSPISRPKVWNGTLFGEGVDGQGEGIELAENKIGRAHV